MTPQPSDPIEVDADTIAGKLDLAADSYDKRADSNRAQASELLDRAVALYAAARRDRGYAADCRNAAAHLRDNEAAK